MSDGKQQGAGSDGSYGGLVHINPEDLGAPRGYSHGTLTPMGARILLAREQQGFASRIHRSGSESVLGRDVYVSSQAHLQQIGDM